jgi:uncharacterized protein YbjT (DUF2867 family)
MLIAVLGAGGKTGAEAVKAAVEAGHKARAVGALVFVFGHARSLFLSAVHFLPSSFRRPANPNNGKKHHTRLTKHTFTHTHSQTVRDPAKYDAASTWPPGVEVVAGDVTRPATLGPALAGADATIFAASAAKGVLPATVDNDGVGAWAAAAKAAGASRAVLVSSALVDPKNGWHPIRLLLNNMRPGKMMDQKWAGEAKLRASG